MYLQNSFTAGKAVKFNTKLTQHCPPHLKYVAALPKEIRSPNLAKITLWS